MDYIKVMIFSMVPVIELRGAIPLAVAMGLNPIIVFIVCVLGSTLVSIPLLLTFRYILEFLKNSKIFYKIGKFIDDKINKRMNKFKSATILGIIMFVGIPLPTTGTWTAAAIASILKMRLIHAITGIFIGNMVAGIIVLMLTLHII